MTQRNWKTWLGIFAAILVAGQGVSWLLWAQGWVAASHLTAWIAWLAAAAWIVRGLWLWRDLPRVQKATNFILGTVAMLLVVLFAQAMGYTSLRLAVTGVYWMAVGFFLGLMLIRALLAFGHPILGVARTLIDEAIRMKVALVFIVALVLLVPALPMALDPAELLKYRVQSFLTWSLMATGVLLSLMTIFLAVGTITNEVSMRQIFLTMTKPVSRGQYLAGKWLGIALLNVLLVAVCGGGIYVFTQLLVQQQAQSPADRMQVEQEVLAARVAITPEPPQGTDMSALYQQRLQRVRQQDPAQFGEPDTPVPTHIQRQVQQQVVAQWYTIGPRQSQTYVFRNVRAPVGENQAIQFRLKPRAAGTVPEGYVHLDIRINDRPYQAGPVRLSDDTVHILRIRAEAIENGELRMTIRNPAMNGWEQPSISFNTADGLQMLYRAGGFESNLLRSLAMIWLRLGFLAMLGLTAGTFMSFPTASLLSLMVYVAAAASGFLHESLQSYATFPGGEMSAWDRIVAVPALLFASLAAGEIGEALKLLIRLFGQTFMLLVPAFGEFNPTPLLADGLTVSWTLLRNAILQVGLIWTGLTAVVGWAIFRSRELARVTV
ncbi:MAG: ABC transporter permease subunit [Phycisphaeraceae bacterium]